MKEVGDTTDKRLSSVPSIVISRSSTPLISDRQSPIYARPSAHSSFRGRARARS